MVCGLVFIVLLSAYLCAMLLWCRSSNDFIYHEDYNFEYFLPFDKSQLGVCVSDPNLFYLSCFFLTIIYEYLYCKIRADGKHKRGAESHHLTIHQIIVLSTDTN
ncbi:hypothetical protein Bca4012_081006 [Brassica carinata]